MLVGVSTVIFVAER